MKIHCDCVAGKKYCNTLVVLDYGDKDCEIQVITGNGTTKNIVFLNEKSIKKLIKFLNNLK